MHFATGRVRENFPHIEVTASGEVGADTLLLLSHVISELSPAQLDEVIALASRAGEIIWVEAGTYADSRRLIGVREALQRGAGLQSANSTDRRLQVCATFAAVAPCTHRAACGLLAAKNARHWCHHFARVPSEIFQDARWMDFGRELGIDLRSLPYSFLVLAREAPPHADGFSRVLGEPREFKGHAKVLSCHAGGVAELMLQKRDAPALHKAVLRAEEAPLFRWQIANGRIAGGERGIED
jgi:ribosomal protein RSM22 (predicted rRNA methylase)